MPPGSAQGERQHKTHSTVLACTLQAPLTRPSLSQALTTHTGDGAGCALQEFSNKHLQNAMTRSCCWRSRICYRCSHELSLSPALPPLLSFLYFTATMVWTGEFVD